MAYGPFTQARGTNLAHLAGQGHKLGGVKHGVDVFVGARSLLGQAAERGTSDEDALANHAHESTTHWASEAPSDNRQ